jgi:hypothetical protein
MRDRAVSVTLGYVLALAISTLLVTGLVVAGGGFVEDQREQVIQQELNVIGQHLASNLEKADRLASSGSGSSTVVAINQTFSSQVTGTTYNVGLVEADPTAGEPAQIELSSARPEVSTTVNVTTLQATVDGDSATNGGAISVQYDPSTDELVIDDA